MEGFLQTANKSVIECFTVITVECCLNRYKKVLDNKGNNKTGRARKQWAYFDRLDNILGGRASSVSLRAVPAKALTKAVPPTAAVSDDDLHCLVRPSFDTDEDDCSTESHSLSTGTGMAKSSIIKRKRRDEKAPQWYLDSEKRLKQSQDEWRAELCRRMDKQEELQQERISVLKETNSLLRQLIKSSHPET